MEKSSQNNLDKRLSDGLLGRKSPEKFVVNHEISNSILAISALLMLTLASCAEEDKDAYLNSFTVQEDTVEESNLYIGEEYDQVDVAEDFNVAPSTYVFHNEGIFAQYGNRFNDSLAVFIYFEDEGELKVIDTVIEDFNGEYVLNVMGIPKHVQMATLLCGDKSFVFEKNLLSKVENPGF
jgi:hypothetical protein